MDYDSGIVVRVIVMLSMMVCRLLFELRGSFFFFWDYYSNGVIHGSW